MVTHKLLLVSVFGPYGAQSAYETGTGMQMELLDNQVTREQGLHSPRVEGTYTYGLYLMAENITVPTVVLDFPSWEDFVAELRNGYTHVGISFIAQNVLKVRRMAEFLHRTHPDIRIILGGPGTSIPDLENIVPCDDICHGEGISWLRRYFGEDDSLPVARSILTGPQNYYIYGRKIPSLSSSIFPGVGCASGCDFCCTTHKFRKTYIPFIRTGREMFNLLREEERRFSIQHFTIEDENFLKHTHTARQLLAEMESLNKAYSYFAFSSADAVNHLGVDFISRLGVNLIWIGIESKKSNLKKLRGVDLRALVRSLRSHGVAVLGSAILFLDHHDPKNIIEDIDWIIGLETEFTQFVALTPCPGTKLFQRMKAAGRLADDYPFHLQNGLDRIHYSHPNFSADETRAYIDYAFRKSFEVNGPSMLNLALTSIAGYRKALELNRRREREGWRWDEEVSAYRKTADHGRPDQFMRLRLERMRDDALRLRPLLTTLRYLAPNRAARAKALRTATLYDEVFGRETTAERAKAIGLLASAGMEGVRGAVRRAFGKGKVLYQPPVVRREFNLEAARGSEATFQRF